MVDNHFRVESNWEDEILKQEYRKETQGELSCTHGSEEQEDTKQGPETKRNKTEEPEPETKDNTMLSMMMTERVTEEQRTIQSMWEQCAKKTDINKYVAAVAIFTEKEHQGSE